MLKIGQFVYGVEILNLEATHEGGDTVIRVGVHFGKVARFSKDGSKVKLHNGSVHFACDVCEDEQQFRSWLAINVGDCEDVWYTEVSDLLDSSVVFTASTESFIGEDEWGDRFVEFKFPDETTTIRVDFDRFDSKCPVVAHRTMEDVIYGVRKAAEEYCKREGSGFGFDFPHCYTTNYDQTGAVAYRCPNCSGDSFDWEDTSYELNYESYEELVCLRCGCRMIRYYDAVPCRKVELIGSDLAPEAVDEDVNKEVEK